MKTPKLLSVLFIVSTAANADLATVAVDTMMLHQPDAVAGVAYCGTVEYTLAPLANDSVFVSLTITPAAGGTSLPLGEMSGDVGAILVNTNQPAAARRYRIFFQTTAALPGVNYVAHVTADAVVTAASTQTEGFLTSLTKSQKATLMGGDGYMQDQGAGAIPPIYMSDGPLGVRVNCFGTGNATCFPANSGLAATWDTACSFLQGAAIGEEFRAYGRNCMLAPAGDLVFHPQGGRASEYFSEDPFLSGRMMAANASGIQSKGVIAAIKHYAGNNKEDNRVNLSANFTERSLRELYLYNWQPSVVQARCWGVMGAYNKINNSYACSNRYTMTTVLRNEWAYKYLTMTDWGASVDNVTDGMNYGVDIGMAWAMYYTVSTVIGYPDSTVNMHARRIILSHQALGDMVSGYNRTAFASTLNSPAHAKVVRDNGAAGIVLARNTGNILPLPKTGAVIAVTGPFRNQCRLGPAGSSMVSPPVSAQVSPLQGMRNCLSGMTGASTIQDNNTANANYIVVFVGVTGETEGNDRPGLAVGSGDGDADAATALGITSAKTVVVFTGGSAACAGNWSKAGAIVIAFYPGQEQGNSIADVLFGNVNPSGRLPVTFPQDASQLPNFTATGTNLAYPRSDSSHGYFRVNKQGVAPLFAFGRGLSYTTFSFSDLQVYPPRIKSGDRVFVKATVTNTGTVAGKEVAELYLSMPNTNASLPVRVQDLRGFRKVQLDPGASAKIEFQLTAEEMRVFNPNGADYNGSGFWTVLPGNYGVRVGASSDVNEQPSVSGGFSVQ